MTEPFRVTGRFPNDCLDPRQGDGAYQKSVDASPDEIVLLVTLVEGEQEMEGPKQAKFGDGESRRYSNSLAAALQSRGHEAKHRKHVDQACKPMNGRLRPQGSRFPAATESCLVSGCPGRTPWLRVRLDQWTSGISSNNGLSRKTFVNIAQSLLLTERMGVPKDRCTLHLPLSGRSLDVSLSECCSLAHVF